jgi:hypothetical protein
LIEGQAKGKQKRAGIRPLQVDGVSLGTIVAVCVVKKWGDVLAKEQGPENGAFPALFADAALPREMLNGLSR